MEYLHQQLDLAADDLVEVALDNAANVMLLDPTNYEAYRNHPFRYQGGYTTTSPFRINVPHAGRWHLVVDLGGGPGAVRASVAVHKIAASAGAT